MLPFVAKFNIFPFISFSDIVSISELTLILTIIDKCDVEHIMTLPIKNKNISYYGFDMVGLAVILVIMSVSTF